MTCFDQQNLLEVILNEFWSLDLKRPHSFHSCPFAALTLLGEDARASLLEDERPHGEREAQHQMPATGVRPFWIIQPPVASPGDGSHMSDPSSDQEKKCPVDPIQIADSQSHEQKHNCCSKSQCFGGTSLVAQMVKASAYNARDLGSIPGLGRSPGEGNGNPLQYSCLENSMDGGAW